MKVRWWPEYGGPINTKLRFAEMGNERTKRLMSLTWAHFVDAESSGLVTKTKGALPFWLFFQLQVWIKNLLEIVIREYN